MKEREKQSVFGEISIALLLCYKIEVHQTFSLYFILCFCFDDAHVRTHTPLPCVFEEIVFIFNCNDAAIV